MSTPITVLTLPAFSDNYLWLLVRDGEAAVVDPGDAAVVQRALDAQGLRLSAILVTHHHGDHIGGIAALRERWDVPVYGPIAERDAIGTLNVLLGDGDEIEVLGEVYTVLALPGHTLGHIAFYCADADDGAGRVFCGDTLFSAGCGRLFEGSPEQMAASLHRLATLPASTRFYCAHEYTAANLAFARAVLPEDPAVLARSREVDALRERDQPSVPGTIGDERRFNMFLRCDDPGVRAAVERETGEVLRTPVEVFAALRRWKDGFRG